MDDTDTLPACRPGFLAWARIALGPRGMLWAASGSTLLRIGKPVAKFLTAAGLVLGALLSLAPSALFMEEHGLSKLFNMPDWDRAAADDNTVEIPVDKLAWGREELRSRWRAMRAFKAPPPASGPWRTYWQNPERIALAMEADALARRKELDAETIAGLRQTIRSNAGWEQAKKMAMATPSAAAAELDAAQARSARDAALLRGLKFQEFSDADIAATMAPWRAFRAPRSAAEAYARLNYEGLLRRAGWSALFLAGNLAAALGLFLDAWLALVIAEASRDALIRWRERSREAVFRRWELESIQKAAKVSRPEADRAAPRPRL